MSRIRGVILDIDGTLVASNDAHAHAWREALLEQGIDVPLGRIRKCIGMGGDKLLPEVSAIPEESPRGRTISRRRGEIFKEKFLPSLSPTPGARELLQAMKGRGLRLVVASSAKKDELDGLLKICDATDLVESATSSDDAERSKPDPDIVQVAVERLELPKQHTLMLGDTPYDVEAARRAAIGLIALRCGGWKDSDLAGAIAIYDDPADLLKHYDSSPLGARS